MTETTDQNTDSKPVQPAWLDAAERIEVLLREIEGVGFVTDPVLLSRHLAERGVRVDTEGTAFWMARWLEAAKQRDDAALRAYLWKEVARALLRQRNDWRTDARREEYRADYLGRAHRECHIQRDDAIARAEKAEAERDDTQVLLDDALSEVARFSHILQGHDEMTPRELLDAAWDAAYVPEDGVIPAGAAFIEREVDGQLFLNIDGPAFKPLSASEDGYERRLLDAPEPQRPARPEGAEELEAVIGLNAGAWTAGAEDVRKLANLLASEGVRATAALTVPMEPVVTDKMVERARRMYPLSSGIVRDMLTAALTEDGAA